MKTGHFSNFHFWWMVIGLYKFYVDQLKLVVMHKQYHYFTAVYFKKILAKEEVVLLVCSREYCCVSRQSRTLSVGMCVVYFVEIQITVSLTYVSCRRCGAKQKLSLYSSWYCIVAICRKIIYLWIMLASCILSGCLCTVSRSLCLAYRYLAFYWF
jgi:hypothetical protein